jgi:hypothetical protein
MLSILLVAICTSALEALPVPSGKYEGSVPSIIHITADFTSATFADFDINIKVIKKAAQCAAVSVAISDTTVTFPDIHKTGDCIGDAMRAQNKDVTKCSLTIDFNGSLTFHSDGYPDIELKKQAAVATAIARSGKYDSFNKPGQWSSAAGLNSTGDSCLDYLNKLRQKDGMGALTYNHAKQSCVDGQCREDSEADQPHKTAGECGEAQLPQKGSSWFLIGQCEAQGQSSCEEAIQDYYDEGPGGGHHDVIMHPDVHSMTYSMRSYSGQYHTWWTHDFFSTEGDRSTPPASLMLLPTPSLVIV